jgi:probable F420-dependent oxidoreductase
MQVDVMLTPRPLQQIGHIARAVEASGIDGALFTEGGRTAYLSAAAAAVAAPSLELSTGVAVAFPRSPMVTAQVAWELHEATGGRFRLGLGTQVRTHIVRRYSMPFESPGPRLRDYVQAVKACFGAFRGEQLEHRGSFYELTWMSRQWSPGAIEHPDPKVDIAAVNPWMLRMAGEVHVHPIGEPGYLQRHVVPTVARGATEMGRDPRDVSIIVPVNVIVGDTDAERAADRELLRGMLSFYGSTPNYAFIWDEAGFEGTTARIRERQQQGDLAGMAAQITDDHLATFCTESTWDGLAQALVDTYGGIADRLVFYNALMGRPDRLERFGEVARRIHFLTES